MISADMEPLLFLCLLTLSGLTFGDQSGTSSTVTKEVGKDAILPCSIGSNTDVSAKTFEWTKEGTNPQKQVFHFEGGFHSNNGLPGQDEQFKGRVSHFPEELKHGNASIKITKVTMNDKGKYICIFPNTQSGDKSIELVVEGKLKDRTRDNIPGAAPKPNFEILNEQGLVQCEVERAFPEPTVKWMDSNNQIIPSKMVKKDTDGDGLFSITIQSTVTKSGYYLCVSTQEDIRHQSSLKTYVSIGNSEWWAGVQVGVGVAVGVIALCVIGGVVLWCRCKKG